MTTTTTYPEEQGTQTFRGFTEAELKTAFKRIANPDDWKAPINARIKIDCASEGACREMNLIEAAAVFYTATQLTWDFLGGDEFVVSATGYRNGPCGDN